MTTPPPYGSPSGQPEGYPSGSTPPAGYGPPGYAGPPSGAQPAYGQQPGYPPQPGYGPQPGYPPPGYPPQPGYGQQPGYPTPGYPGGYPNPAFGVPVMTDRRPGMVTAAAVLAFIWGAFAIIGGLLIVAASSVIATASAYCSSAGGDLANECNVVSRYSGSYKVITAGLIVVAILLIWGGVVALTGKNGQILVIGAAVYILLEIIALIISASSANGFASSGIIGIVAPVLMLAFMLNGASRSWFRSKGAKTF